MAKKSTPWSVEEVTTFLRYIADDKVQRKLDGTTRNIKVFQEVSTQTLDSPTALLESARYVFANALS